MDPLRRKKPRLEQVFGLVLSLDRLYDPMEHCTQPCNQNQITYTNVSIHECKCINYLETWKLKEGDRERERERPGRIQVGKNSKTSSVVDMRCGKHVGIGDEVITVGQGIAKYHSGSTCQSGCLSFLHSSINTPQTHQYLTLHLLWVQ